MKTTILLAAASLLAISAGSAASAAGSPALTSAGKGVVAHRLILKNNLSVLYNQNDNDGGTGIDSQAFESTYAQYDDQGADDFVVPGGHKWIIHEVDVTGVYFNGSGPAASENVYFYKNGKNNLPTGTPVASFTNVVGADNGGSFAIKLPTAAKLKGGTNGKTYWVSVQANCSFGGGCGEWGWEIRSVQGNNPAAWQNYGGAFGICPTWNTLESCLGYGPDFMFALKGKQK